MTATGSLAAISCYGVFRRLCGSWLPPKANLAASGFGWLAGGKLLVVVACGFGVGDQIDEKPPKSPDRNATPKCYHRQHCYGKALKLIAFSTVSKIGVAVLVVISEINPIPSGWTLDRNRSSFVPMEEQLFTLIPFDPSYGTRGPGLTLREAFTRLMAFAGRDYMFFRTGGWVMHLVIIPKLSDEPEFESTLSVDSQARAAIMRQVCEHGLGLFKMVPDEQLQREGMDHECAA